MQDGTADPRLARALVAWAATGTGAARTEVLAAFVTARVYAALGTGRSVADIALLSLVGSAGDRALPAFLDVAGVVAFHDGARPGPRSGQELCAEALGDGAVAVLLDPPGAAFTLLGPDLAELAAGRVPVAGAALSARTTVAAFTTPSDADPQLLVALGQALAGEPVTQARLLDGPDGPVLGVVPDPPLDAAGLAALAARVLPRLAPHSVDLAVVGPQGPGTVVRLPDRARKRRLRRGR